MDAHSSAEHGTASKPKLSALFRYAISVTIAGIDVGCLFQDGKVWMALRHLVLVLGYKPNTGALRNIFANHGHDFFAFTLRLPVGKNASIFVSEDFLRLVCELVKPERTQELRRWLEAGGIQQISDKARPQDQQPQSAAPVAEAAPAAPSNVIYLDGDQDQALNLPLQPGDRICSIHARRSGRVVRVYDDGSVAVYWNDREPQPEGLAHERMPRHLLELMKRPDPAAALARRKDYCRELCRVIARYADEAEITELARALEGASANILARRYCPGLNAAAYEVFRQYGMKGSEQ